MGDWSETDRGYNRIAIGTTSPESVGIDSIHVGTASQAAGQAWPAVNRAIYIPFVVYSEIIATKMNVVVGTASGSIDIAIYTADQSRLVSSGPTSVAGSSAIQTLDITDTTLGPGVYYMAMLCTNTNATFTACTPGAPVTGAFGVLSQAVGAATLPNPATFAAAVNTYVPFVMIATRTTI